MGNLVYSKIIEDGLVLWARLLNRRARVGVLVEVLKVSVAGELRHPRWLDLLLDDHGPVDAAEPGVRLDVIRAVHHAAEALTQVLLEQARDELAHVHGDLCWEVEEAHRDPAVDLVGVLVVERWVAREHLKDQDSECPPVNAVVMADRHDNLRREVLWCPAQRERLVVDLFGEPKVCDFHVTVGRHEQILRLQVSVGDALLVEVLEGQHDLSDVEERDVVREQILAPQQSEDLTALHVLEVQVHVRRIFEAFMPTANNALVNMKVHKANA